MIRRVIALLAVTLTSGALPSGAQQAPAAPVRSPEVHADRRVTFRLVAPKAAEVRVTCECLAGPQALQRDERGVWSTTVGPIDPDIYEYEFQVDGMTIPDLRNIALKYNSRPGPPSSLLDVPGSTPMFYDLKAVPHGKVEVRWYHSKTVNGERRVHVYTPPGYDGNSRRLPVLYLLHGADGDDSAWANFGRANFILDNLIAERAMQPMIVVMPFGYPYPPSVPATPDRRQATFEDDLVKDIIPFIQSNYRVRADRESRALVGLSMGGGQALNIGLRRLDLFSNVAGFSAAVPRGNGLSAFDDVLKNARKVNDSLSLLWIGCGTDDSLYAPNQAFSERLKASGIDHTFKTTGGAHTWIVWRRYLHEVAPKLFP